MTHANDLPALIEQLRHAPKLDRVAVEHATGARLAEAEGSNDAFAMREARNVQVGKSTIKLVDLREPRAGGGATAGALLNLSVGGECIARAEIEKRYGPLQPNGIPTGRSLAEETKFSRREHWGMLTFGFAEATPDCLSSVTFAVDPQ